MGMVKHAYTQWWTTADTSWNTQHEPYPWRIHCRHTQARTLWRHLNIFLLPQKIPLLHVYVLQLGEPSGPSQPPSSLSGHLWHIFILPRVNEPKENKVSKHFLFSMIFYFLSILWNFVEYHGYPIASCQSWVITNNSVLLFKKCWGGKKYIKFGIFNFMVSSFCGKIKYGPS